MTRAPLSVTVDDSSKVYGDENPAFAVRFDGFVLGQGVGVLGGELEYATEATTSGAVGGYGVAASGLANYAIKPCTGATSR